ncbi:hypothetical protein ACFCX0_23235 [Streptomyces sp. NPDC056352]|uniref:hypothetical protein n=1 Tax=Streptomyces sp. NPDC056352 TaxID=3345791 RepID=UPI0035DE0BA0
MRRLDQWPGPHAEPSPGEPSRTDNRAGDGGGLFKQSGTVTLNGTVVRRNHPNNCSPSGSVLGCIG